MPKRVITTYILYLHENMKFGPILMIDVWYGLRSMAELSK